MKVEQQKPEMGNSDGMNMEGKELEKKESGKQQKKSGRAGGTGNPLRLCFSVLCLCISLGCIIYLGNYFLKSKKSQDSVSALRDMIDLELPSGTEGEDEPEMVEVNGRLVQKKYAALYEANPDFIGWVTIPDTKVDYPVMQHPEDNEYYLHRNFEGEWDDSGLPFLDLQCSFTKPTSNMLIYGHNMKAGTMFSGIISYKDEEFYKEHKTFTFNTIDGDGEYEVIAAFYSRIYPEEDTEHFKYYQFFDAYSAEDFDEYVREVKALSSYEIEADASYGDSLITLSTCAYHTEDGRFAVVARKREEP